MDIRDAIIKNFGPDNYVVKELNKHGLRHGIAVAKRSLAHDNMSEAAKVIRYWQPPDVLIEKEEDTGGSVPEKIKEPPRPPLLRKTLRHREVRRYTVDNYVGSAIRPTFWHRVLAALLRARSPRA